MTPQAQDSCFSWVKGDKVPRMILCAGCCGLNKVKNDKFTSFIRTANSSEMTSNFVKYQNLICKLKIYLRIIGNYSSKRSGRTQATFYQLLSLRTALKVCK